MVDDLHTLYGSPAEASLEQLLGCLPTGFVLVMASRRIPSFALSRLRVQGDLLEVGSDDLRFRAWEVEQLFKVVYGQTLSPSVLSTLTRRTEGWAARLQLFHLASRQVGHRPPPPDPGAGRPHPAGARVPGRQRAGRAAR